MKIGLLGAGGAFDPAFGHSSAVVETGAGTRLLLDCGGLVYSRLQSAGLLDSITHVLITHLHDDHVGSLGSVLFYHALVRGKRIHLVIPPILEAGIRALLGSQITFVPLEDVVQLVVLPGATEESFVVGETRVDWIETTNRHQQGMPSCGFVFTFGDGERLAWSGDLGDADFFFQELTLRGFQGALVFHDLCFVELANGAHAYYTKVQKHLEEWRIVGYHHDPTRKPADCLVPLAWEGWMHPDLANPQI